MQYYPRHIVLVMVDRLDLAVLRALRYAGSLRPNEIRAVHVAIDNREAATLQKEWIDRRLGDQVPLQIIGCEDRRLVRAAAEVALRTVIQDDAEVTVLLPRRTFRRLSQRLLHDRTADRIAEALGRIPHVAATIVPFDTTLSDDLEARIRTQQKMAAHTRALTVDPAKPVRAFHAEAPRVPAGPRPDGTTPIADVVWREKVTIEGRIEAVQLGTSAGRTLEVQVFDDTGGVRLLFLGRTRIPGITPGTVIRATGRMGEYHGHLAIANPRYELVGTPILVS